MSRSEIEKAAEMEKSKAVRTLNSLIEKKILKKQVQIDITSHLHLLNHSLFH